MDVSVFIYFIYERVVVHAVIAFLPRALLLGYRSIVPFDISPLQFTITIVCPNQFSSTKFNGSSFVFFLFLHFILFFLLARIF